jgi:hypothetical protein
LLLAEEAGGEQAQGQSRQGQAGEQVDQHDGSLRLSGFIGVEVDPTLTVLLRKAFVAMVDIDAVDGGFLVMLLPPSLASPLLQSTAFSGPRSSEQRDQL